MHLCMAITNTINIFIVCSTEKTTEIKKIKIEWHWNVSCSVLSHLAHKIIIAHTSIILKKKFHFILEN